MKGKESVYDKRSISMVMISTVTRSKWWFQPNQ